MKIRPGIVMRSENAKNQFLFPMMSNTRWRLAADDAPARRSGGELRGADPVQPRAASPVAGDDDPQDRARHEHGGEHRDEDADDQDEGEALDDRRPEEVQD